MFIKKDNVEPFLRYLSWKHDEQVYVPAGHRFERFPWKKRSEAVGMVEGNEAARQPAIDLDRKTLFSAKKLFFPQREELLSFRGKSAKAEIKPARIALFGARPCDLNGIKYMDMVFRENPYYMEKRKAAILIGIQCAKPRLFENCYCHYTSTFFADNYDLLFIEAASEPSGFLVKAGSPRGEGLLATKFFSNRGNADDALERMRRNYKKLTRGRVRALNNIREDVIRKIAKDCFSCTACTAACPTCHSFMVRDELETDLKSGSRIRTWDSCQLQRYTRVAGDTIFRPTRLQRVRQRIMCKFRYSMEEQGMMSCTGCGRCVDICNKGIDMFKIFR